MREIEFRGKRTDHKGWVYGSLFQCGPDCTISPADGGMYHDVNPETVGQYTGLKDSNDVKIFEGDIVRHCKSGHLFLIKWHKTGLTAFQMTGMQKAKEEDRQYIQVLYDAHKHEVIGNIHDKEKFEEVNK